MYFSFLICEIKCDAVALNVINWQNTHSMTVAVKEIVKLFKVIKHKKEIHWKIFIFSVLHNYHSVRMYSHYLIIEEDKNKFYCYLIKKFSFTSEEEKNKWTVYKFIKNVYNIWMLIQHKKICSVINKLLSNHNFNLS